MPQFSKRHYEIIARVLRDELERNTLRDLYTDGIQQAAEAIAVAFADDNPQFKPARFLQAAGIGLE